MGFQNEKDHPEVAPSQFEINYGYGEVVAAADQIQLYKLICRQVATNMGLTASFLPKPVVGVNGSGMHTNVSISEDGKNLFWDAKGEEKLSKMGWAFLDRILTHGNDICLLLNASVNAYRRLDPHFEAPNQIKASPVDRGSMIRIPIGNEKSMRVEVRSVAPDANPYLVMYSIFKTGLDGETSKIKNLRQAERYLPDNIYDALANFRKAEWTTTSRRRRKRPLRRSEASLRRPLPARSGNVRERHRKCNSITRSTTSSCGICSRPLQFCHETPRPKAGAFCFVSRRPPPPLAVDGLRAAPGYNTLLFMVWAVLHLGSGEIPQDAQTNRHYLAQPGRPQMKVALIALVLISVCLRVDPCLRFYRSLRQAICQLQGEAVDSQHTLVQPDPGKARVYFIEDAENRAVPWDTPREKSRSTG